MATKSQLKQALRERVTAPCDRRGYVQLPTDNLVDGVSLELFEDDLRRGRGNELQMKFCAAHSSAALVVNCFAWFKRADHLNKLQLLGEQGAISLCFERQCPVFKGGTPPHFDVWIERDHSIVAVESKLMEYFTAKAAQFSCAYDGSDCQMLMEEMWQKVYRRVNLSEECCLDVGQLIKHYLGIRRYKCQTKTREIHNASLPLLGAAECRGNSHLQGASQSDP